MKQYLLQPTDEGSLSPTLTEVDLPEPGPGEVRVKMEACSLNYRDLLMMSGQSASSGDAAVVPLSDGAGVVSAVGEGVTEWAEGDCVALTFFEEWKDGTFSMKYHKAARGGSSNGVLAEEVISPAHGLVRIPEGYSTVEAATLPCAAVTAWHGLMERSRPMREGDTVLCLGTGGVSIFALQLAKAAGANVIITSSSDEKLERAAALGADELVNYRDNPDWEKVVFEKTEKRGVDHVIEVGGPGTLEKSMSSVGAGGSIALIGVLTGFDAPDASLFPLVTKNVDLSGIYVGSRSMFERLNHFLGEHQIRPVIDREFAFEEVGDAYDCLKSGSHFGKVVVRVR